MSEHEPFIQRAGWTFSKTTAEKPNLRHCHFSE